MAEIATTCIVGRFPDFRFVPENETALAVARCGEASGRIRTGPSE